MRSDHRRLIPRLSQRARWQPEDPVHRAARIVAIPAGLVVIVIGAAAGNVLVIASGAALLLRVAMASPKRS